MEGRYNLYSQSQSSTGWTSMRNEDLQEEDVWGVLKERKEYTSKNVLRREFTSKRLPAAAARMIPRANINPNPEIKGIQHSAPVNIPDWSKIYGNHIKKASKNASWLDDGNYEGGDDDDGGGSGVRRGSWDSDDEDDHDDYDDGNMIPPHEWIAKKLARSQISSFSVCEGAGRTLKGRDLSRVRNAILTKTGFLE